MLFIFKKSAMEKTCTYTSGVVVVRSTQRLIKENDFRIYPICTFYVKSRESGLCEAGIECMEAILRRILR